MGKISSEIKEKAILNKHTVDFTTGTDFPGNYPLLQDNTWNASEYANNMVMEIVSEEDATLEFDIIGSDAPIANALRRVLLSEVPSVAIGRYLYYFGYLCRFSTPPPPPPPPFSWCMLAVY